MENNDSTAEETSGTDSEEPSVTYSGEDETRIDAPDRAALARIFTPEDVRGEVEISTSVSVTENKVDLGLTFRVETRLVKIHLEGQDALALAEDIRESIELAREAASDV